MNLSIILFYHIVGGIISALLYQYYNISVLNFIFFCLGSAVYSYCFFIIFSVYFVRPKLCKLFEYYVIYMAIYSIIIFASLIISRFIASFIISFCVKCYYFVI